MRNLYSLFTALCFGSLLSARAQDSTVCNPGFSYASYQHTVNFQAVDMHAGVLHSWSFGDGSSQSSFSPAVSHTYRVAGNYLVKQVIRDSMGGACHDSSTQQVRIDSIPACAISFIKTYDSTRVRSKIYFIAFPSAHEGDSLSLYVNGVLVSRGVDSIFYDSLPAGSYTVCVKLQTVGGCTASECQDIVVNPQDTAPPPPPPMDSCSVSFSYKFSASMPNEVQFNCHDSTGQDSLTWFISRVVDSVVLMQLHGHAPVYVFPDTGCYNVDLYAVSPKGCFSWAEQSVCIDSLTASSDITSYPNPALSESHLQLNLDQDNTVYINIFNSMGYLVLSKTVAGIKGLNQISLPTVHLPKGMYYVQIRYGNVLKRSKIQKL
jgi:PKD repeat protein